MVFGLPTGLIDSETSNADPATSVPSELSKPPSVVPLRRLAKLNKSELPVLLLGVVSAIINVMIFPIFGTLFSSVIKIFYETPHELRKDSKFWAELFIVLGVAYPLQSYFFSIAGCRLIRSIRSMSFQKVVHMEVGWFDEPKNSTRAIGAHLFMDAASVRALVGDALAQFVQNASSAVSGLVIAFEASWQLALIVLSL